MEQKIGQSKQRFYKGGHAGSRGGYLKKKKKREEAAGIPVQTMGGLCCGTKWLLTSEFFVHSKQICYVGIK